MDATSSTPADKPWSTTLFDVVRWLLTGLALLAAVFVSMPPAHAAAPAGSQIGNQASATYSDGSAVTRTVTSNTVITTVQQVASVALTADGAKRISVGGQVYYPHTLTNTGNGNDTVALSSSNSGTLSFSSVLFYADVNGDGIPDNAVPLTSSGQLAPGQVFKFVAAGIVPPTAVSGNVSTLTLTATSGFNATATATAVDTTTVTGQAVVNVTQLIDVTSGPSPSTGQRTVTVTYTNTGNTTATNLVLAEAVPSGMAYVAGSARWSVTGSGVTLTDADGSDNQGGIVYDQNVTSANRVTATVATVPAGGSGTLSFKVTVNGSLPAGANAATAATITYSYNDGAQTLAATSANTLQYTVLQTGGVTLSGATSASASQGGTVNFTNTVANTGNAIDSFDLSTASSTFPAGTSLQWFQADGVTPLVDTNGNGIPDTGPLAAAGTVNVVLRATLPTGASGGPFTVQANATSKFDLSKVGTATDTLTAITGSTLDLTNDTAGNGSPGLGAGPEALSVSTLPVNPGATVRFTLVAANGSSVADSFGLQASTDVNFATQTLPSGWKVVFKDGSGALIDHTGLIAGGANKTVYADVSVPAGTAAGTTQIYFRALSPTTGAADRVHDAVTVNTLRSLVLAPNHSGQATAGGTVVYEHILSNTGNVLEGDGSASTATLAVTDSLAGFTSLVYWDRNNDGTLDPTDPVITNLSALTGGSNGASTAAGLFAGETARLFVKVSAPAGAAPGSANVSTLTVSVSGTISGIAAPAATVATDGTSVIASQVVLVKMHALDANCDGTADTAFSVSSILTGAAPGGCIRYEITATNAGPVAVTGLTISDATPAYTTYSATVAATVSSGSVAAPANGAAGSVQATVASLAPGQSVVMRFGVRIEP